MRNPKKKLLFLVNVDWFFVSHRLPIAIEALNQGYEVHIATGITDKLDELQARGFIVHPLAIGRSSTGLIGELRTFLRIVQIFKKVHPDIVHLVTIKPVLFGGIAARIVKVPGVVAAISGLGYVFLAKGTKAAILRFFVARLYRLALGRRNLTVICQNPDDQKTLVQVAGIEANSVVLVPGSGVELFSYTSKPLPQGMPVVVMAARLLRDKGVAEFVAAAKILKQRGVEAIFYLAGEPDAGNPASIDEAEISAWRKDDVVELLGHVKDIAALFSQSTIVVLPSYREGLPKVLIEAAACGRAVVTTDVPGCRDAIVPDKTGILVPPRDAVSLADAIQYLLQKPEVCNQMGQAGRLLAEQKFSIEKVVSAHLEIYRTLAETTL